MKIDLDDIISKWSFEVSTGMPDVNNPAHLVILENILMKLGYEEISSELLSNLRGEFKLHTIKENTLDEGIMAQTTKLIDYITGAFNAGKVSNLNILNKIKRLVDTDAELYGDTIDIITTFGIPNKYATEITRQAFKMTDPTAFNKYLHNRTLNVSDIGGTSLVSALQKTGIDKKFLAWLVEYNWVGNPTIGKAEAALAILLNGAYKPKSGGDIQVNGAEVEIKLNGGRVKGQSKSSGGVGDGNLAASVFKTQFESLIKLFPKDVQKDLSIPTKTDWNLTANNWGVESFGSKLIAMAGEHKLTSKINKSKIVDIWVAGFQNVYNGISNDYLNFVDKLVNKDGSISNKKKFLDGLFVALFKFYYDLEGWHAIIVMDKGATKIAVLKGTDAHNESKILKTFRHDTSPSYASTASSSTFKIFPK